MPVGQCEALVIAQKTLSRLALYNFDPPGKLEASVNREYDIGDEFRKHADAGGRPQLFTA